MQFQILVCFYCDSVVRRVYYKKFIESLREALDPEQNVDLLFIDGSPTSAAKKNKAVTEELNRPHTYILNQASNPIKRIEDCLSYLTKENVLWLLEDQIILVSGGNFLNEIEEDCIALSKLSPNDVIQYPVVNSESLKTTQDGVCSFRSNAFRSDRQKFVDHRAIYSRREDRKHLNYLCHNVLYERNFFEQHIKFYGQRCSGHSKAEQDVPDLTSLSALYRYRFTRTIAKALSKIFYGSAKIRRIYVSQSIRLIDFIHIGYESNETSTESNEVRIRSEKGIVLNRNLSSFSDINFLQKMILKKEIDENSSRSDVN